MEEVFLPPVSVAFFTESSIFNSVVHNFVNLEVSQMMKVETIENTGLLGALQLYQTRPTPELLVLECLKSQEEMFFLLEQLAEFCDPNTKVVMVGESNDLMFYRKMKSIGVSDYFTNKINADFIVEAFLELFKTQIENAQKQKLTPIVSFIGSKGGVGTSTVSLMVGHILSQLYLKKTAVIDFDSNFGSLGDLLNVAITKPRDFYSTQSDPTLDQVKFSKLIYPINNVKNMFVLPSYAEFDKKEDLSIDIEGIKRFLRHARSGFDFLLSDLGRLDVNLSKKVLDRSSACVIVAEPDKVSLKNAILIYSYIHQGNPSIPVGFVVNKMNTPRRQELPSTEIIKRLGIQKTHLAEIIFDPAKFSESISQGAVVNTSLSKNALSSLESLVYTILNSHLGKVETNPSAVKREIKI